MKYEKDINCYADYILQMLVLNWYLGWCTMFLSAVGIFFHSPSSGKFMNDGVCEGRESAHAQFRPERIIVNFMWWCFMTLTSFSTKNPYKYKILMCSNIHFLTFITNEMIIFLHYNDNKDTEDCIVLVSLVFSKLSLVLNKECFGFSCV